MRLRFAGILTSAVLLLTGCGSAANTYTQYVQSVLDCTYRNATDDYLQLTGVTQTEADTIYTTEVERTAQLICTKMDVKYDMLTEKTKSGYTELAVTLLGKVRYTVQPAVRTEGHYQVSIVSEPIDLWEQSLGDVEAAYVDEFAEDFAKAEGSEMRQSWLEKKWGTTVLHILNEHMDTLGYQDPVGVIIQINADEEGRYTISANSWTYLDAVLLDVY